MFTSRFNKHFLLLLASLTIPTALPAAVEEAVVGKEHNYHQQGPTSDDVVRDGQFRFIVEVGVENQSDASNVSIRREGGTAVPIPWNAQDGEYWFEDGFATEAALHAAYPAGDYFLTFTPSGGSRYQRPFPSPMNYPTSR